VVHKTSNFINIRLHSVITHSSLFISKQLAI
jgi:hypothetical protein